MFDFWPKPPREIKCPRCGAIVPLNKNKNSQVNPKPFCRDCGWNVDRARRDLLQQLGVVGVAAGAFAVYAWAMTGTPWAVLGVAAWFVMAFGLRIFSVWRELPRLPSPSPPLTLRAYSDVKSVTLEVTKPRLNVALEALIALAFLGALLYLPRELDPARRILPSGQNKIPMVAVTMVFFGYQLCVHAIAFYRFARAFWTEQHLLSRSMVAEGRVQDSKSGNIRYEFSDYTNQLHHGSGRDYTLALYEDMTLRVLYDPDDPSWSIPLVGLQFHRTREEFEPAAEPHSSQPQLSKTSQGAQGLL